MTDPQVEQEKWRKEPFPSPIAETTTLARLILPLEGHPEGYHSPAMLEEVVDLILSDHSQAASLRIAVEALERIARAKYAKNSSSWPVEGPVSVAIAALARIENPG